uniref:ULP_PROTEASE domain-containing protein n=1 Tax=Steinernema glaseri TaxID=37863 RepID=A0A1I7ZLQ7_9BILA
MFVKRPFAAADVKQSTNTAMEILEEPAQYAFRRQASTLLEGPLAFLDKVEDKIENPQKEHIILLGTKVVMWDSLSTMSLKSNFGEEGVAFLLNLIKKEAILHRAKARDLSMLKPEEKAAFARICAEFTAAFPPYSCGRAIEQMLWICWRNLRKKKLAGLLSPIKFDRTTMSFAYRQQTGRGRSKLQKILKEVDDWKDLNNRDPFTQDDSLKSIAAKVLRVSFANDQSGHGGSRHVRKISLRRGRCGISPGFNKNGTATLQATSMREKEERGRSQLLTPKQSTNTVMEILAESPQEQTCMPNTSPSIASNRLNRSWTYNQRTHYNQHRPTSQRACRPDSTTSMRERAARSKRRQSESIWNITGSRSYTHIFKSTAPASRSPLVQKALIRAYEAEEPKIRYSNMQSGQVSKQYAKNFPDDLVLPLHFTHCGSEESHIDVLRTLTTPKEVSDIESQGVVAQTIQMNMERSSMEHLRVQRE